MRDDGEIFVEVGERFIWGFWMVVSGRISGRRIERRALEESISGSVEPWIWGVEGEEPRPAGARQSSGGESSETKHKNIYEN